MAECTLVVPNRFDDLWDKFIDKLDNIPSGVEYKIIRVDGSQKDFTYAKAMNEGLSIVDTEYVCFMNDDAYPITRFWLKKLISVIEDGFVGVSPLEVIAPENMNQARGMPPVLPVRAKEKTQGTTSTLNGFCLLCRTSDVRKIGGWDTQFEHYFEDNDLSIRLEELGWNAYAIKVHVEHKQKTTTSRSLDRKVDDRIERSKKKFKEKWGSIFPKVCE